MNKTQDSREDESIDNKEEELAPKEVYNQFVNLVDDPEVGIAEVLKFLDNKNRIKCLLESGLPFVQYVVESGEYDLLEAMLEKYDDQNLVSYKDSECKCTPLHIAAREGNMYMVKLLLEKGASVTETDNLDNTVFDYACSNREIGVEIFKECQKKIDTEIPGTPLNTAVQTNNIKLVQYLVANCSYMINKKFDNSLTACHLSVISVNTEIFRIIIESSKFESSHLRDDIDDLITIAEENGRNNYITEKLNLIREEFKK